MTPLIKEVAVELKSSPTSKRSPERWRRLASSLLAGAVFAAASADAATLTWDASGANPTAPTDGAGNWSTNDIRWTDGIADSVWLNGSSAIFGSGGAGGAIGVGAGTIVGNLTINTNYTFANNTLTLTNFPTIAVNSATSVTIGSLLSGTAFTKEGNGTLILNPSANNTFAGLTVINKGTVQVGGNDNRIYIGGDLQVNAGGIYAFSVGGTPAPGNGVGGLNQGASVFINGGIVTNTVTSKYFSCSKVVLENGGTIWGTGSDPYVVTNTDARSGGIFLPIHRIVNSALVKSTPGTVIVSSRPNSSGTDGYVVTLNGGTLIFDYGYTANNANRFQANAPLNLGGGLLMFSNNVAGVNPSANNPGTGGTFVNAGASSIYSTNAGASGGNLTMGAITRRIGGTVNLRKTDGPGLIGSSSANVNGIVGGWATYNGTDFTTGTSTWTNNVAYTTSTDPTTWAAANNVSLNASTSPNVPNATTINSLRLTSAATVTLDGTLTLSSGGLLATGSGANTVTGGTLLGASGSDLVVHQYSSGDLTINSTLADNGAATSLTKSGSGKLVLSPAANTMTGTNFLNGGVVEVSDLASLASGPLVMNAGTLRYTGSSVSSSRALTLNGVGATLDIGSGTTVTQTSAVKGSGAVMGDLGGLTKIGAGTLVLTASNYYNGPTVVSNGVLVINGTNAYDKTTFNVGNVTLAGGILMGNGLISGPVTAKSGSTIAPGTSIGTLTLATNLTLESGSTNLFEVTNSAAGDSLVVQGNLNIQSGARLAINVLGAALAPSTNVLITYTGTKTGSFNPTVVVVGGSLDASVSIDESTPGQIKLIAVPQVVITSQPVSLIVSTNDPASFSVSATGSAPLSYQWYFYGDDTNSVPSLLTDATNASFSIGSAQPADSGYYTVVVSNSYNAVSSTPALLIVGNVAPVITGPTNRTVIAGNNATFSTALVIANPLPTYQWQTNGVNVGGATTTSLTLSNVDYGLDNTLVSVIASNDAGVVTNSATLTVIVTPVISPQPVAVTTNAGATVVFTSGASGVPTPGLQWYKNNSLIAGETNSTLTLANVQGGNVGTYKLVATNAAGTATSASVKLTVVSTALTKTAVSPANGATGVCYDTPLYVTFNNPLSIINSGRIRIYNAANPATPVDTIDMSSNTVVISTLNAGQGIFLTNNIQSHGAFPGDSTAFNYFPVILSNNVAAIYPHAGVMTSNQTYFVTLETGVVGETDGSYFAGISDTNEWRFSTKTGGPVNPTNLVVAADGSGDFVTVQGAVDSIPTGGYPHSLINIRDGNYVEIVNISGKSNITLRGQSRLGTVIGYGNNNNLNPSTANRMAFKVNANDIAIENLTLVNRTPQGGSQAETLMLNTGAARFILNNADVNSLQDTILANVNSSQGYLNNSTVRGNFDYIWGGGNLFVTNCVIRTVPNIYVTNNYNLTAARTDFSATSNATTHWLNPSGSYTANGFSFVNCRLEADPAVTTVTLAGANGLPNGLDAFIGCLIDTNHYVTPAGGILSTYVLWESGNSNIDGTLPVSMGLTSLSGGDARLLAAQSATNWLYGWQPALAPNILTNPVSQVVNYGSPATFSVVATGIPDPTYQWQHAGTNLPGANASTLTIASATLDDGGSYAVIVTTSAGSVTSSTATLTVNAPPNTPPVFTAPLAGTNISVNPGVVLSVTNTATDSDSPAQTLTYTLLTGPTNASINASSGVLTWRPLVTQADSVNAISVVVTDDGTPALSATNDYTITVGSLAPIGVASAVTAPGQLTLTVTAAVGPDYAIEISTNLTSWSTLFITNSPPSPFTWDADTTVSPMQFYRVKAGPPLP